jgi:P pilus assembly chaperone PapD
MNYKGINIFKLLTLTVLILAGVRGVSSAFTINPYYLVFEGRTRIQTFTVRNNGNEEKSYKVSLKHLKQTKSGGYEKIQDDESQGVKFADDFLMYGPKSFSLQPKESKTIRIQSKHMTSDKPDGEYRSHLYVKETSKVKKAISNKKAKEGTLSMTIGVDPGISIPLVVRKGNLTGDVKISNFKIVKTEDGGSKLLLSLERTGDISFKGKLEVLKDDEVIAIQNGLAIYPEMGHISLEKELKNRKTKENISYESLKGENITVVYTTEKRFNKKDISVEKSMEIE